MIVNKIKYISILSLLFLAACEKEIEIEVKEGSDRLVLNGWFQAGYVPEVTIDKSVFVFDQNKNTKIIDAKANLYSNDELVCELFYDFDKEIYTHSDFVFSENSNYEIVVEHVNYGIVKSNIQIPARLSSENVELRYVNFLTEENQYQNYAGEIEIILIDPSEQRNYYLIRILTIEESWNPEISQDTTYRYVYSSSYNTNDNQIEMAYVQGGGDLMFLKDELFNGGEYSLTLFSYNDLRKVEYIEDSISYYQRYHQIQLHQVSEAFYRYYISLENNRYPDVFTEPTQVYSNIENGYGIIGASTMNSKTIEERQSEE